MKLTFGAKSTWSAFSIQYHLLLLNLLCKYWNSHNDADIYENHVNRPF